MLFKHILIVGVGLIGGSFALAARRSGLTERITGWGGANSLETAISMGIIDAVEESIDEGSECEADFVYLAAPVGGIIDFIVNRGSLIKPGAIITDAGSTKREICRSARESLQSGRIFVGGHPMSGSHLAGVQHARADLFSGAPYAIVTSDGHGAEADDLAGATRLVEQAVRAIRARPVYMTAESHDSEVARVSHVPQLLSIALANLAGRFANRSAIRLAGSGFRDMTRLAQSQWSVWKDVCETNRDEIAASLFELEEEIGRMRVSLGEGRLSTLEEGFEAANIFSSGSDEQGEEIADG